MGAYKWKIDNKDKMLIILGRRQLFCLEGSLYLCHGASEHFGQVGEKRIQGEAKVENLGYGMMVTKWISFTGMQIIEGAL